MELDRARASRMTLIMALFAAVLMLGMPAVPLGTNSLDLSSVENASAAAGDRQIRIGWTVLMDQVETLNPFLYTWGAESDIIWWCYSSLMTFDVNQNVVGDLAVNWTHSADYLTWHIKLAHGATFYNRLQPTAVNPVTSADVAFSYWLAQNTSAGLQSYFPLLPGEPGRIISNIETPTPYDVIFHIRQPYAPFFSAFCNVPILPKYIWQNESYNWANFRMKAPGAIWPPLVGSGPFYYVLDGLPTTGSVELARNPTWFESEERGYDVHVDRLIMKSETEDSNYQNYKLGANDVLIGPTVEQWLNGSIPGNKWQSSQGYVWEFNMCQMTDAYRATHPAFKNGANNQLLLDPIVKRALQKCVNKTYIAQYIFQNTAKAADSLVPQVHPYHYTYGANPARDRVSDYAFDPLGARDLLYAAGWKYRADGTEILSGASDYLTYFPLYQKVGGVATNVLSFSLITPNTDTLYDPSCRLIEGWAAQAGVDLVYPGPQTASYMNNAWYTADYDVWLWNWWMMPTYDISTELMIYYTTAGIDAMWSDVYYSNETFDAMYYASMLELDPVKRKVITDELQRLAYENSGCWPVVWIDFLYAAQSVSPDYWTNWGNWTEKFPLSVDAWYYWLYTQIEPTDNPAPKVSGVQTRYYGDTQTFVDFSATVNDNTQAVGDLEYQWNYGDGNKSGWITTTTQGVFTASHKYERDGYYDVYFMVREKNTLDKFGNWGKSMAVIKDLSNWAPNITASVAWPGDPDTGTIVYINGTAVDDNGDPITYTWNFGDGTTAVGQHVTHQFAAGPGGYTVTLMADDGRLGYNPRPSVDTSLLVSVTANRFPSCVAKDEPSVGKDTSYPFKATVSDQDSRDRLRLTWDWGDGTMSVTNINSAVPTPTQFTAYHTYKFSGNYVLTVYSDDRTGLAGHNVSDTASVNVFRTGNSAPYVVTPPGFTVSNSTPNTETQVTFYATVNDANGDLCIVNFTFGDGTWQEVAQTSVGQAVSATHTYVTATSYLAYVDATDGQTAMGTEGPLLITVSQAEFVLNLVKGWNFVTVPRTGWGYYAKTLGLQTYDSIYGWNPTTKSYDKSYIVGLSSDTANFAIEASTGYWVNVLANRTLHLYGVIPSEPQFKQVTMTGAGWVALAFNSLNATRKASDIPGMFAGGSVSMVAWYDAVGKTYKTYIVGLGGDFTLQVGQAYWVSCSGSGTFSYEP